jgi:hypothetical protein
MIRRRHYEYDTWQMLSPFNRHCWYRNSINALDSRGEFRYYLK